MTGGPAFALRGLTKRFGRGTAVDGVSVEVAPGEVVAVLGPNGAGKSTTVDMLLGLTEPDAGEITVAGGTPREAVDRGVVGAMMQNGALLPDATVGEIVGLVVSTRAHPLPASEVIDRAGLGHLVKRRCSKLSGGERQRVRFALALAGD